VPPDAAGLRVRCAASWPEGAQDGPDSLPRIAGFVLSSFNPLVALVAERCLDRRPGPAPLRTAILLASASGDLVTARALADAVREGRRVPPLLFFQSNPNAVLGHVAARRGLTGPVVSLGLPAGGHGGIPAAALAEAELLLLDGDAEEVLVIAVEQGSAADGGADRAEAVLVDRPRSREEAP
jgi:hypothetical protein